MNKIYSIFILALWMFGCITDFDMDMENTEGRLVVDAKITNQPGPYYVRLTKSNSGKYVEGENRDIDDAVAVKDAFIVLSDDQGQFDTLTPVKFDPKLEYISYDRGYYKTDSFYGVAGRTYFLKIVSEGKEYAAQSYMPEVPEIDSLSYILKKNEIGKDDDYIPILYFNEPQGVSNYYLIDYYLGKSSIDLGFSASSLWEFSILSDEFLEPYVNGLYVENGSKPDDLGYYWIYAGALVTVRLQSLTKEAFLFYKILLEQFEFDGGTYKPTPASPPTNLSNGALGFFRASASSTEKIKIPEQPPVSN